MSLMGQRLSILREIRGIPIYKLVAACSPLDSRDAPDVVLAVVLQLLENLEEFAGDLELVIGVNSHPLRVDVARFGCDQALHCVRVVFVVVGNTPRPGPSAHELAVLALPGYSSHQNVIAYREMRQTLAATGARAVVTTIGVDALQHPRQELRLGIHQRNDQLLQPVFVDRAELKTFVVSLNEKSKGRTRLPLIITG